MKSLGLVLVTALILSNVCGQFYPGPFGSFRPRNLRFPHVNGFGIGPRQPFPPTFGRQQPFQQPFGPGVRYPFQHPFQPRMGPQQPFQQPFQPRMGPRPIFQQPPFAMRPPQAARSRGNGIDQAASFLGSLSSLTSGRPLGFASGVLRLLGGGESDARQAASSFVSLDRFTSGGPFRRASGALGILGGGDSGIGQAIGLLGTMEGLLSTSPLRVAASALTLIG